MFGVMGLVLSPLFLLVPWSLSEPSWWFALPRMRLDHSASPRGGSLLPSAVMAERPLGTFITLILEDADAGLAQAHRELYPERIPEHIPLSLTLLYPWIPAQSVTEADVERVRAFFAGRPLLEFELTRLAEYPGKVVYGVPEPDDKLRATMRALWAFYPEYPPYGEPGGDPPPHCTLGRLEGELRDHVRAGRRARRAHTPGTLRSGGIADGGVGDRPVSHSRNLSARLMEAVTTDAGYRCSTQPDC